MKLLSICKPDLLKDSKLVNEYFNRLIRLDNINNIEVYNLENWALNSLFLYEYDCMNLSKEENIKKRKELLVTAKGYDIIYNDKPSYILLLDVNRNNNLFKNMKSLKKDFRKDFVYGREASYIKFLNENFIDFSEKFNKETLLKIKAEVESYKEELKEVPDNYNLIYFNMVHLPVTDEENEYELDFLDSNNYMNKKTLVKRLIL